MTTANPAFGNTAGTVPANLDGGESTSAYTPTQNAEGGNNASPIFSENIDGGNA